MPAVDPASESVVEQGFGPVADAFRAVLPTDPHQGAALSVWIDGRPAVELQGGASDRPAGASWTHRTVAPVHSATKGVASLLIAMLVERGSIPSYETPIGELWPQFDREGKGSVSVGDALAHRAGVSAPRRDLSRADYLDPHRFAAAIAEQAPLWAPGSAHQYHALTHGAITQTLIEQADGRTAGSFLREELADPLDADIWIGLPTERMPQLARPGRHPAADEPALSADADTATRWTDRTMTLGGGMSFAAFADDLDIYRAEAAGAGGVASASALARVWSSAVTPTLGVLAISADTVDLLRAPRSVGRPFFGGPPPYQHWGAGVMIPSDAQPYLTPRSFGHDGGGGMVAFADADHQLGFGFVTTELGGGERGASIVAALGRVLS